MGLETSGKYKYIRRGQPKLTVEHRLIMHQKDPRDDEENLVVHHIDGNKANNDPSNLMWMTNSEHQRLHHLDENHFPCAGEDNANYRHGMCVGGQSKEYKSTHNKKCYQQHREERLAKQNVYCAEHREHKRWYDKINYWTKELSSATSEERRDVCLRKIQYLKENKA